MNGENKNLLPEDKILSEDISPPTVDSGTENILGMETRTVVAVEGMISPGQPIVDKVETTGMGQNGMAETTRILLRYASGCSHIVHTASEAGAFCADGCGRILCTVCASKPENLCSRCRQPVAGSCQKQRGSSSHREVFCRTCWRKQKKEELIWCLIIGSIAMAIFVGIIYGVIWVGSQFGGTR